MMIETTRPLHIRWAGGELHLKPGHPVELSDDDAVRLLAKKPDTVRPVIQAGDWVEWLSPALPKQHGEVLAVYLDQTFEVYHPLAETVRRLPMHWVTKIVNAGRDFTQRDADRRQ